MTIIVHHLSSIKYLYLGFRNKTQSHGSIFPFSIAFRMKLPARAGAGSPHTG
jgi:hypothetical protein